MNIQDMISELKVNGWELISKTKEQDLIKGIFSFGGEEETHIAKSVDGLWLSLFNSVYEDYNQEEYD